MSPPRKKKAQTEPAPKTEDKPVAPAEDKQVEVDFGDDASETAVLLLAAAEELHGDQSIVGTGTNVFLVPQSVADKAGLKAKE
jgi:hypothetical protein